MEVGKIKGLVDSLDAEMNVLYEEYLSWHRALQPYSEKVLDDQGVKEANVILKEIQDTFNELYHGYHWVMFRNQLATNATSSFNEFIEKLKAAGAKHSGFEESAVIVAPDHTNVAEDGIAQG